MNKLILFPFIIIFFIGANAEGFELTLELAKQGDAAFQYQLGTMYDYGQKVPENVEEAAKWYRKSAMQGNTLAQNRMGYMYANGRGVPQDYSWAVWWFRKAAKQGETTAQYSLSFLYSQEKGVPKNTLFNQKIAYMWAYLSHYNGLEVGEELMLKDERIIHFFSSEDGYLLFAIELHELWVVMNISIFQ